MTGPPVHPIEAESYAIIEASVDLSRWRGDARAVVARIVHATADESFAGSLRIGDAALGSVVAALRGRATVVCDAAMVVAGVPRVAAITPVVCLLGEVPEAPAGSTRAAAAVEVAAGRHPRGAVWVIGNAPTALNRLIELHRRGRVEPAAVIALPVGYVGAAESKDALWRSPLRAVSITNAGRRGGSAAAAAALNALGRLVAGGPPARS